MGYVRSMRRRCHPRQIDCCWCRRIAERSYNGRRRRRRLGLGNGRIFTRSGTVRCLDAEQVTSVRVESFYFTTSVQSVIDSSEIVFFGNTHFNAVVGNWRTVMRRRRPGYHRQVRRSATDLRLSRRVRSCSSA